MPKIKIYGVDVDYEDLRCFLYEHSKSYREEYEKQQKLEIDKLREELRLMKDGQKKMKEEENKKDEKLKNLKVLRGLELSDKIYLLSSNIENANGKRIEEVLDRFVEDLKEFTTALNRYIEANNPDYDINKKPFICANSMLR